MSDSDILKDAKDWLEKCRDAEAENRETAKDDIRFARLGEQWPSQVKASREAESRPCLTINRMPTFIRQVVNDARQNKPSIVVKPADSGADPDTAEVINGLIRNIEYTSNADVAYDTAIESAVSGGFGYIRVKTDYAYDDVFDLDILIERVSNQFSVFGDPNSTAADSSDWNIALVTERLPKAEFKRRYGDKANVDFESPDWSEYGDWLNEDGVLIAEYWVRQEVTRKIYRLSNGQVVSADQVEKDPDISTLIQAGALQIVAERDSSAHEVTQYIVSGLDVLETNEWPGRYIPIIPVYGDEFTVDGKRYFRSLIHPAKDPQRMMNYWRSTSTELVALAPRVPFIGPKGAFKSDADRWNSANRQSHAYLEYDGAIPPQRQPLDMGVAAGALQEAMNAADDMKATMGLFDAAIGARSNETSGKAILARQREGDVATFHFIDNLSRAIRHTGRVIIDLIPHVYSGERIIRVLGQDGKARNVPLNQETPAIGEDGKPKVDEQGNAIMALHDLTAGKYDLAVDVGPSYTTRREETAAQITEMIRAFPQAAPILGGPLAKNMDWPGAQEIAEKLEKLDPTNQQQQGIPPELQQQIAAGQQRLQELEAENAQLKADLGIKQGKLQIDQFDADTRRMKVQGDLGMNILKAGTQPDPTGFNGIA